MEDLIKRFIYTSVGFVSQTTTKIREVIDELIRDRKISEEEGKRIIEDFTNKTKSQAKELEDQVNSFSSKLNKGDEGSTESEIVRLKKKIQLLEERLVQANNSNRSSEEDFNESQRLTVEHIPLQEKRALFQQKLNEQSSSVDRVVNDERVSLGDEVLTPERKIKAEQKRMQSQEDRPSANRHEQDTQKANLSSPILTPGKKVEQDKKDQQ